MGPDPADDFIMDNCKNIYHVGHETSALSATWCLMLLTSHPEWQAWAELIDVCHGQMPDVANMFGKMKVLTMVIQETLCHYPPAAFVIREYLQDMKLGDFIIPKDVTVRIPIASLHHDPEIWGSDAGELNPAEIWGSDAGEFNPGRF